MWLHCVQYTHSYQITQFLFASIAFSKVGLSQHAILLLSDLAMQAVNTNSSVSNMAREANFVETGISKLKLGSFDEISY